jgi:hypothetical protein
MFLLVRQADKVAPVALRACPTGRKAQGFEIMILL